MKNELECIGLPRNRTKEGVPFDYIRLDSNRELLLHADSPLLLYDGGLMICLQGECEISVNFKPYRVTRHDLLICFPHSVVQINSKSVDFRAT